MSKLNNNLKKLNSAILEFASDIRSLSQTKNKGNYSEYGYTLYYDNSDRITIENINHNIFNFYELTAIEFLNGYSIDDINDFLKDIK